MRICGVTLSRLAPPVPSYSLVDGPGWFRVLVQKPIVWEKYAWGRSEPYTTSSLMPSGG